MYPPRSLEFNRPLTAGRSPLRWDKADLDYWREVDTSYTFVDPMIRALGWDVSDPKECYPEYSGGNRVVDYALFRSADMGRIGRYLIAPDVIIEAKKLRTSLDQWVHKLHDYAAVAPRMSSGIGVLTNGGQWWIYNLALRDEFPKKLVGRTDVLDNEPSAAAHVLDHRLGRLGIGVPLLMGGHGWDPGPWFRSHKS